VRQGPTAARARPLAAAPRHERDWSATAPRSKTASRTLLAFGHPCPVSDLLGTGGQELLHRMELPEPWAGDTAAACIRSTSSIATLSSERALRRLGVEHRYGRLLGPTPGIGWVLGFTIAAVFTVIVDMTRFASPTKPESTERLDL
jgi:hypothetical protein